MSMEKLMVPRYKVIAGWPYDDFFTVGSIITDPGDEYARDEKGKPVPALDWGVYPHLFRKLEWWEYRDEKDLPTYIKSGRTFIVYEVKEYLLSEGIVIRANHGKGHMSLIGTIPATLAHYEAQNKEK